MVKTGCRLSLTEILHHGPGCLQAETQSPATESVKRVNSELLPQAVLSRLKLEAGRLLSAQAKILQPVEYWLHLCLKGHRVQQFLRLQPGQLVLEVGLCLVPLEFHDPELTGGEVKSSESQGGGTV